MGAKVRALGGVDLPGQGSRASQVGYLGGPFVVCNRED
jgi:hypothetical protein